MISLHPMVVSKSVSRVAVPVITKAVEKFIIIYRFDSIINEVNLQSSDGSRYKIQSGKVIKKVTEGISFQDWYEDNGNKYFSTLNPNDLDQRASYADWLRQHIKDSSDYEARQKAKDELEKLEMKRKEHEASMKEKEQRAKSGTVSIGQADFKTISLEPTWTTVEVQIGNLRKTTAIGVKVLPALAQSDEQLSNLLMYDKGSNAVHTIAIKIGRWAVNILYKLFDKMVDTATFGTVKTTRGDVVTGDVRKDILHNRTNYSFQTRKKSDIFVCLSSHDVSDNFFHSAGGINKLFKMGWTSIIIADDVNRIAHFCMEEYKGQCVTIPYAMLYNTFSSLQVYDSLSDAKQSAGALFKTKFTISKINASAFASKKLKKYRGR